MSIEVNFLGHACAEIVCGKTRIITDPWLTGPAFLGGWQRTKKPPADWLKRCASADLIWISHSHSDHLNEATLRAVQKENPDVLISVPAFDSIRCIKTLEAMGFWSIFAHPFDMPFKVRDVMLTVLRDKSGRDDSGLYVEHKGETLLNTVDANHLNGGDLPHADWLLAPFAGNASAYPICYSDMYGPEKTHAIMVRHKDAILKKLLLTLQKVQPKRFMPFAGYYRPTKGALTILKNSPEEAAAYAKWTFPGVEPVVPDAEDSLERETVPIHYDESVDYERYYRTAGYKAPHLLHVVTEKGQHSYNFWTGKYGRGEPEIREEQYTRVEVPAAIYSTLVANRLPWEEMSVGFHAKLYRSPDVYEAAFWDHFQNKL